MALLQEALCPSCSAPLPMSDAWKRAPKARGIFLLSKTGVRCAACGERYVIRQGRTVAANVVILMGGGGVLGVVLASTEKTHLEGLPQWEQAVWILLALIPLLLLQIWIAPRLLHVRRLANDERVDFPLEKN